MVSGHHQTLQSSPMSASSRRRRKPRLSRLERGADQRGGGGAPHGNGSGGEWLRLTEKPVDPEPPVTISARSETVFARGFMFGSGFGPQRSSSLGSCLCKVTNVIRDFFDQDQPLCTEIGLREFARKSFREPLGEDQINATL